MRSKVVIGGVVACALGVGMPAVATPTFTGIADSTTPGFDFFGKPAINNAGQVAFWTTGGAAFVSGIYRGTGGPLTPIARSTDAGMGAMVSEPSINDSGVVAFKAYRAAGDQGVYKGSGGGITLIDTIGASFATSSDARVSINASGLVAFHKSTATGDGIYKGDGVAAVTPVDTNTNVTVSAFSNLQMNDSGVVAYYRWNDASSAGIYSSASTTPIALPARDAIVSFNNSGRAAFLSITTGPHAVLYTGALGATPTPFVDDTGPFSGFTAASINNLNAVAFLGTLDDTRTGIFVGTDPVADKVIATGDALFGSTVMNLGMWSEGLNDIGDVAFSYFLANGRSGVAVAHNVPAPAAGMLLVGLSAFTRRRRR